MIIRLNLNNKIRILLENGAGTLENLPHICKQLGSVLHTTHLILFGQCLEYSHARALTINIHIVIV